MRCLFITAILALTGCETFKGWFGSGKDGQEPPVAVPVPNSLGALGNTLDKGDSKVASAVTVMIENSDKPPVVKAEGRVALAHLPYPEKADLEHARKRAAALDAKSYDDEVINAKVWLAGVEKEWREALVQSKKNADELVQIRKDLASSKTEVVTLKAENKKIKEDTDRNMWSIIGGGMFVIGVLSGAVFGWKIGGSILACAPLAAAVPVIITSQYFNWIAGGTLGFAALLGLWRLADYIKDRNDRSK